ncbi:MAG TPA: hypothetical protein VFB23_01275 [Candidatus Acidoferrales bacterium]|jgi:hypothetical protein|nr:hypothetical protein [Candidatus Acidoferrales bacterium]
MNKTHGVIGLVAICLIVLALSAMGIASDFFTRLGLDLDGLLLILASLLMGVLFLIALLSIARDEGWIPQRHKKEAAVAAPAGKTAAPRTAPAKPAAEEVVSARGEGK